MGEAADAILRSSLVDFCLFEHPENFRESTVSSIRYLHLRSNSHVSVHRRDDRQDAHTRNIEGKVPLFIKEDIIEISDRFEERLKFFVFYYTTNITTWRIKFLCIYNDI